MQTIQQKKDQILNSLVEHQGLNSMIELSSKLLNNPVFIYDISGKILAKSSLEKTDFLWNDLIANDCLDASLVKITEQKGIMKFLTTQDQPVIERFSYSPYRFMGCRVRDKDSAVAIITIVEQHPFIPEDEELLIFICKTILFELLYRERTAMQIIPYYSLFRDIIEGTVPDESIRERVNVLHLSVPNTMCMLGIRFSLLRQNNLSLHFLRENLMNMFPSSFCIIYDNSLLMVVNEQHVSSQMIERIQKNFAGYQIRIGVSRSFTDIRALRTAYQEIKAIQKVYNKLNWDQSLTYYKDIQIYHFIEKASEKMDVNEFCSSYLELIKKYDTEHETQFGQSIEAYLEAGRNIQKAAEKLHMHKNTLYYRLKRAEDLFQLNFDDENLCFTLQFSFRMRQMSTL